MIGTTISHYRILEKLGEGGMGVVYKAEDLKLTRIVALKFLPRDIESHEPERARFLQEARAAAILNHPNICTVYDIQEQGGQLFIVMEYVDGRTLREALPVEKPHAAVGYGIQIAEALQEAHAKGIVHRDLKADNIMVNAKNQVKVMDFGLAKLKGSLKLTRTHTTTGTLAYMAPEQVQGEDVDGRADIFSLGVVLFEALTGRLPFKGEHDAAMMYSILNEDPLSLEEFRRDCPADMERIIRRALEKDPEDRYQHADDMLSDLRRIGKQTLRISHPVTAGHPGGAGEDLPGAHETVRAARSPGRLRRVWLAAGGILLAAGLGVLATILFLHRGESVSSMAVLPFVNAGGDENLEYLTDGFTEGLINTLSRLPGVKMMSSRSVFRFKGKEIDPAEAARELHVDAVLMGRILQRGDELSLSVELINSHDNSHLWGEQYHRRSSDLVALQREISREISARLNVSMTGEQERRFTAPPTSDNEAYQVYLKGKYLLNRRTAEGFAKSLACFREAVGRDPSFAYAWAGLAQTYTLEGSYLLLPAPEAMDSARANAERALLLDNSLGEAHAALASTAEWAWDWTRADREYRTTIELSPNFASGHQWYGEFLGCMGRLEEGLAETRKAQELDPLSPVVYTACGYNLVYMRRYDEAIQELNKALALDPQFARAHAMLGLVYLYRGDFSRAILDAEKAVAESDSSIEYLSWLGYVYGTVGNSRGAEEIIRWFRKQSGGKYISPAVFVVLYAGLGDADHAFEWLDRALEIHDPYVEFLKVEPSMDRLRPDKRFGEMLRKVGFP